MVDTGSYKNTIHFQKSTFHKAEDCGLLLPTGLQARIENTRECIQEEGPGTRQVRNPPRSVLDTGFRVTRGRARLKGGRRPMLGRNTDDGRRAEPAGALDVPLILRNRNTPASNGEFFERVSPVTGEVVSRAAAATVTDALAAVAAAAAAFPKWSALGPGDRRARLLKAAAIIEDRVDLFVAAMADETGATGDWARFNELR